MLEGQMKIPDLIFKILAALALPLLAWGVKLEVNLAVQDEKIAQLSKDVEEAQGLKDALTAQTANLTHLEAEVREAKSCREVLSGQATALGKVEEKLNGTISRLDEIKADLRRSLPPGP